MGKKILVATVKPFAKEAIAQIKTISQEAGYELILLEKYSSHDEFLKAVKDVDALIVRSDKVTKEVIDAGNNLKIIVRGGAGYDNIDIQYAKEKNIVVMNTPGQNSNAVAELAFGMMVYIYRNKFNPVAGRELREKTIGIHAFGHVGKYVAKIAKGFGMRVLAYDPFLNKEDIEKEGVEAFNDVKKMYAESDFISLHLPKNKNTIGSINYELLSVMKDTGCLVNTARKEVINEDDLLKIMEEKPYFKYVSDIAPDKKDEFLNKFENRVYFTPKKMGAQTLEANVNAAVAAIKQIIDYFENGNTTFQVNK